MSLGRSDPWYVSSATYNIIVLLQQRGRDNRWNGALQAITGSTPASWHCWQLSKLMRQQCRAGTAGTLTRQVRSGSNSRYWADDFMSISSLDCMSPVTEHTVAKMRYSAQCLVQKLWRLMQGFEWSLPKVNGNISLIIIMETYSIRHIMYHQQSSKFLLHSKCACKMEAINQSINQSIGICIAPPTNSGRRRLTMWL